MAANKISVRNIGPVLKLDIDLPPNGEGVVVLRGRNGVGKSSTIRGLEDAINPGRQRGVTVTDGQTSGQVEAFGVEMRLGRRASRLGELEVETLEGKLSIADLVDPQIANPASADAKRIKALIQLSDVAADPSLFWPLFGGEDEFESVVEFASLETTDLVELAARVKRDAEKQARAKESEAEHARQKETNHRTAAEGLPAEGEADKEKLDAAYSAALLAKGSIDEQVRGADAAEARYSKAREEMKAAKDGYKGVTVEQARADEQHAKESHDAMQDEMQGLGRQIDELQAKLAAANARAGQAERELRAKEERREAAEQHHANIRALQEVVLNALPSRPSPADVEAATKALDAARAAVAAGETLRKANEHRAEAERWRTIANKAAARAMELRNAAERTDEVLSDAVSRAGTPLLVEAGRLKVAGTKRTDGKTNYGELSQGERARLAVRIAVEQIKKTGKPGLIALSQELFEGLDPVARQGIADEVVGTGIVVLTAEASSDEEITAGGIFDERQQAIENGKDAGTVQKA